jgi:hypothetical protein
MDSSPLSGGIGKQPAKQEAASPSESLFDIASPIDTPAYLRMKDKKPKFLR